MNVKKIFIPTLTAIMIASQLTGCAAVSQSEMLEMINNQQAICIEVAVPKEAQEEQGEEITYDWKELASLDNYEAFRLNFDDTLGITAFGDDGKNGVVYVDLEGNHTNNSTFYYAMMNKKFRNQIADTDTNAKLVEAAYNNYVDVESDAEAKLAYINAYFNILEDAEPNYYNGNSAVTRAEFLSAVYRAKEPVKDLEEDIEFTAKVDPAGDNEHTIFAQQMLDYNYLGLSEKSLNKQTFDGDITRAEAIYTLVKYFYADEYEAVTGKETAFTDAKNGGNIALKEGFIETKKNPETKEKYTEYKDYWMSYELQYAINNPDGGLPEALYKAMVVAKQVGLVTGDESRWDEAITKNEALNMIFRVYSNMETITNVDRGYAKDESVEAPATEADGIFENEFADYTKTDESLEEYEVIVTEQLDTNLYVIKEADILKLDQEGAGAISPVEIGAYLTVTGKTSNGWYEIQWNQLKGYLPADVLSTENPIQNTANPEEVVNQETGMTTQETLEKFEEIMKGFDDGSGGGISQEVLDNATVAPDYDKTPAW